jgi:hypothetical protein
MRLFTIAVVCALTANPAAAQEKASAAPPTPAQIQARHAIAALEGVLENAVRYGAQMLDQRLQASTAANMVMLAGMARARGFRLDDYGVVFDVEFPSMRRSMVWSLEQLERANRGRGAAVAAAAAPVSAIKPQEIYLNEIASALADAIVDHSAPIGVGADEWLTVAARESVDHRFVPGDPTDTALTIMLRVKGSDLSALRERKMTRDEVRKRVDIKRY